MLFCAPVKGDEFFVYELAMVPAGIHLLATFSRGYTYSRVVDVTWRVDSGVLGVISARGTGHVFSLKRRGKETGRAVGKVKMDGGVKGMIFLSKEKTRRRSSMQEDKPDILTLANTHDRLTSWKLAPAQNSTIGLLSTYFNPPISDEKPQSIPLARAIAEYTLPITHQNIQYPTLSSSPAIKAAFTNQKDINIDCTAKAEVECSLSTHGITTIRSLRLFEYTLSPNHIDFSSPLPLTTTEINLGMPHGDVRFVETPPSSEQDSPNIPKRQKRKPVSEGIEGAISASLGTELDKTRIVTIPPTPPASYSTPLKSDWRSGVGDIFKQGKTIVRNARRKSELAFEKPVLNHNVDFEEDVQVLSLDDGVEMERSESEMSEGSGNVKLRDDGSVLGAFEQWEG
jgi:hypothetical protein